VACSVLAKGESAGAKRWPRGRVDVREYAGARAQEKLRELGQWAGLCVLCVSSCTVWATGRRMDLDRMDSRRQAGPRQWISRTVRSMYSLYCRARRDSSLGECCCLAFGV
jgi:hypothetical protein